MTAPPPLDPRMERDAEPESPGWRVVVQATDGGEAREYVVTRAQLTRWRALALGLAGAVAAAAVLVVLALPRSLAYPQLLAENLSLKEKVQAVDERLSEVDRILLRMRMYDAQLRHLQGTNGDHGPLPEDADLSRPVADLATLDRLQGSSEGDDVEALRPAEAWANAVVARADQFIATFDESEPDLNLLLEELETLQALKLALPHSWPASGNLTSGYGPRRSPFGFVAQFHNGIDVANRRGTPIYAAAPGKVIRAEYNGGFGRMIEIDHGFGISTLYGHCTTLKVERGDEVEAGEYIATMGSTGRVTGPHLHFEVHIEGRPVNPMDYLPR